MASGQLPIDPARNIWELITEFTPDIAFDLHTSRGLTVNRRRQLGIAPDATGQAIYPTPAGTMPDKDRTTLKFMSKFDQRYQQDSVATPGDYAANKANEKVHAPLCQCGVCGETLLHPRKSPRWEFG